MGLFKKKGKFVDWSEGYKIPSVKKPVQKFSSSNEGSSDLGFLGDMANGSSNSTDNVSWDNDSQTTVGECQEKKTKLMKRLMDMTNRMEDLSNQIYHLKQRIELLEKKMKVSYE